MTSQANNVPDPESAREEAERLVATGLAAVAMAADRIGAPTRERGGAAAAGFDALGDVLFGPSGHRRHEVANDSDACCRCPVCRVIAAARQPDPEFAERLATGAGDVAEGAARLLRTVVGESRTTRSGGPARATGDDPWGEAIAAAHDQVDDPWAEAIAAAEATAAAEAIAAAEATRNPEIPADGDAAR